jgi:hypothetical protein
MNFNRNRVPADVTNHLLSTVASALFLMSLTALVCPVSLAGQAAKPRHDVVGRWQGKFPAEQVNGALDADNPVAVEVVVKSEGSKLSGTVVFYVIVDQGNGPRVQGKVESALIDPRFDGTTLMFSVKAKGPEADKEVKTEMRMKLTNDNEAELENVGDTTAPLLKMKKVPAP